MSSTPTATFGLLLSAVGLRCLVTAAFLGCGLGAGLAYGHRWGLFVSGSGDGLMAICGDCSVAAHRRLKLGASAGGWRGCARRDPGSTSWTGAVFSLGTPTLYALDWAGARSAGGRRGSAPSCRPGRHVG